MLLGNAYIEETLRETLVQLFQASSTLHRRCNTNYRRILLCNRHKGIGKDLCICRGITNILFKLASYIIISTRTMPLGCVPLSNIPAFAFLGHYLHDDWPLNPFEIFKDI